MICKVLLSCDVENCGVSVEFDVDKSNCTDDNVENGDH